MKLTSMQKMLLVAAGMVVVAIVIVVLAILPMFTRLGELDAQQVAAEQRMAAAQAQLEQLRQAKDRAAETQAELIRISNEMPESPELPSLIIELQDVSDAADLDFSQLSPGALTPDATGKFGEIPIDVQVVGRWEDLLDYLDRLRGMTRGIRVTGVSIVPAPKKSQDPTEAAEEPQRVTAGNQMRAYVMGVSGVVPSAEPAPADPAAAGATGP